MKLAAGLQSGLKSDTIRACSTPSNLNEHMLADHQRWNLPPRNSFNDNNAHGDLPRCFNVLHSQMLVIYERKKKSQMPTISKTLPLGRFIGLLFLFTSIANGADEFRFRTWVVSRGNLQIEAQFKQIKGNKVVLSKRGGGLMEIDLFRLSARDRRYVSLANRGMEPPADFDDITKATPFVIDFSKGERVYKHIVKYPLKVDMKKTVVEFTISGNGRGLFPSSTQQKQPVDLGRSIDHQIRLAPPPAATDEFDLAADVKTKMEYDSLTNEFVLYVEPYANVIRGREGAEPIPLSSAGEFYRRVTAMEKTITRLTRENEDELPSQITQARSLYEGSVGCIRLVHSKNLKTLLNKYQSNRNRIPTLETKAAYLNQYAAALQEMKSITVQYRIFLKVGGNLKLILGEKKEDE